MSPLPKTQPVAQAKTLKSSSKRPNSRSRKEQPTQKTFRPPVPPKDPEGKRYTEFFNHGFKPICADRQEPGQKPSWFTLDQNYPLEPRILWKLFQNEEKYVGIRFGSTTRYVMIDIDTTSPYHPDKSATEFGKILTKLSLLGLGDPVAIRSSWSGGIHLYYGFPEPLETFKVALLVKKCLVDAEFKLKSGWLEIFPNTKPFYKNKISDYNAHALPLQAGRGSILLKIEYWSTEAEVVPIMLSDGEKYNAEEVKLFNDLILESAATCDIKNIKKKLEAAYTDRSQYQERYKELALSEEAAEWKSDLTYLMNQGFSGYGQTNWLLHKIGVLGFVFEHKKGDELINYMCEQVISAPGYKEYCRHQHEIEKRCQQWAKCISETEYYCKYRGFPVRNLMNYDGMSSKITSGTNKNPNPKPARQNIHNINQAKEATENIISAIASLKEEGKYPQEKSRRMMAIIGKTKELYGEGVSRRTLYKPSNQELWNPDYNIPDPWESEELQPPTQQPPNPVASVTPETLSPTIAGLLPPAKNRPIVEISFICWKLYTEAVLTYPLQKITTKQKLEPVQGGISHLKNVYEGLLTCRQKFRPLLGGIFCRYDNFLEKSRFQPLGGIKLPFEGHQGLWSLGGVIGSIFKRLTNVNELDEPQSIPQPHQENEQRIDSTPPVDEKAYQPGVTILASQVYWKVIEQLGANGSHLLAEDSNGRKQVFYDYVRLAQSGLIKLIDKEHDFQQKEEKPSPPLTDDNEQEFVEWCKKAASLGLIAQFRDYTRLPKVKYQGQWVRAVFLLEKQPFGKPKKVIKRWLEVRDQYLE